MCGGDVLDPEAVRRVLEAGPPRHLINGYGPTEATVCATWFRVGAAPAVGAALPIGRPVARVAVYVLDPHGEPVPPGVCGEICIAGDGVGRGYHRRPELTAERFPRDPFAARPAATMYRTGDLGRLRHDGQLEFHGRIDQQLKIRGFRVELGEIEAALAEQPGVRQAAVLAVEVAGDKRLVAYVAADAEGEALVRALRGALAQRLPEYMVPAEFVLLDALPVTPNGKLDRAALPAPDVRRWTAGREFVAPRSELEQSLADIWRELLGQPQVGVHDDFFALGGHSLHAVQLFSRLRAVFGVEVRFQEFFGRSTVAELAASMRRARSAPDLAGAIARAPRGEPLPLSFGQERLWFMNRLAPQSRAYNCMYPYRLRGPLDVAALGHSLRALVERHEILQTTYAEIDGRPVQRVAESPGFRLAVADLQHLAPAEREAEVRAQLDAEAQRLFDLERGPLFRAGLLRLGPDEQVLWLHFHHLTMDGWSTELAFRELAALYASASQGLPDDLPPPSVQYADFAAWQRARHRRGDRAAARVLEAGPAGRPAAARPPGRPPAAAGPELRGGSGELRAAAGAHASPARPRRAPGPDLDDDPAGRLGRAAAPPRPRRRPRGRHAQRQPRPRRARADHGLLRQHPGDPRRPRRRPDRRRAAGPRPPGLPRRLRPRRPAVRAPGPGASARPRRRLQPGRPGRLRPAAARRPHAAAARPDRAAPRRRRPQGDLRPLVLLVGERRRGRRDLRVLRRPLRTRHDRAHGRPPDGAARGDGRRPRPPRVGPADAHRRGAPAGRGVEHRRRAIRNPGPRRRCSCNHRPRPIRGTSRHRRKHTNRA
ncbi:condensation domain-containing protein [Nannocystis pusilla]|uniref:Condensation domain-containing protein n=1 Tax=Nannocystis pusilla TaxID=889268 RepID=A0A9X3F139_9BACT|nr:condensation domain-containing protein [Nannocystis pusilla]